MTQHLFSAVEQFGTPLYVYNIDELRQRFDRLLDLFGEHFGVSYAIKSNPNIGLLKSIKDKVATFDASAFAEVQRALATGMEPEFITFSGPGKKVEEIQRAVDLEVGELILESTAEAEVASAHALAKGVKQNVLVRINPTTIPRAFGVNMAGKPSQFGIDEEEIEEALRLIMSLEGLNLKGYHIYSGTNCLKPEAIAENFGIFCDIFRRAVEITGKAPKKLTFGSGFGLPYLPDDEPLDVEKVAELALPVVEALKSEPMFADAELGLEMGRWLVGPTGWLLTSVVAAKHSRGTDFRICDAGFNNQLAACGMMGSVIRRNWRITNFSGAGRADGTYTMSGPLCTTIDLIASNITLPELRIGDLVGVENSGAYGLTASPSRFISHPEPREILWREGAFEDVSESLHNHWDQPPTGPGLEGKSA